MEVKLASWTIERAENVGTHHIFVEPDKNRYNHLNPAWTKNKIIEVFEAGKQNGDVKRAE